MGGGEIQIKELVRKHLDSTDGQREQGGPMDSMRSSVSSSSCRFVTCDEFQTGSIESAMDLKSFMGVDKNEQLFLDIPEIDEEFRLFKEWCERTRLEEPWWKTAKEAARFYECMLYCRYEEAGSSERVFDNSPYPRDCDDQGVRHDRRLRDESRPRPKGRIPAKHRGMTLQDFCKTQEAEQAGLSEAECLALRIYTTHAFHVLNKPFLGLNKSMQSRQARAVPTKEAHPFAATIMCLVEALRKLRKNNSSGKSTALWRGISNVKLEEKFHTEGGTMLGFSSTSYDPNIAIKYLEPSHDSNIPPVGSSHLLLKISTDSKGLNSGGEIKFLSAYPAEKEVLFPPLTFLKPVIGSNDKVKLKHDRIVTIIEVRPTLP